MLSVKNSTFYYKALQCLQPSTKNQKIQAILSNILRIYKTSDFNIYCFYLFADKM